MRLAISGERTMGFREFISETEAAAFAGISQRTLHRFIESGYLKVEHDADGLPMLDREEVGRLFGITVEKLVVNSGWKPQPVSNIHEEKVIDLKLASAVSLRAHPAGPAAEKQEATASSAYAVLETEIQKLKHVLDIQERLLEERERELHQLLGERDWLRKRIERLEEKSERDQILLLSETQTIRKLVNAQVERRTPVRAVLDWLGFQKMGTVPISAAEIGTVPILK